VEKNKLKFLVALFLFVFSFACIFAQDKDNTGDIVDKAKEGALNSLEQAESESAVPGETVTTTEVTESIVAEEKGEKATDSAAEYFPWEYGIVVFLLLGVVALIVLSYLSLRRLIYREKGNLKNEIEEKIKNIEQKYADILNHPVSSSTENIRNMEELRAAFATLKRAVATIQERIGILGELKDKVDILYSGKKIAENVKSGKLDVTEAFNSWADDPLGPLPTEAFYFIVGEMNIRTKRQIMESAKETMWITNRTGMKKYLFPNPNLFNQRTNILELYKMDQSKLKGKGQNRIKIITPCEMTKDGFVEFPGELELL
jgi:hypothetical protein